MTESPEPAIKPPLLGYESSGGAPAKVSARIVFWSLPALAIFAFGVVLLLNPFFEIEPSLGMGLYGTPVMPVDMDLSDDVAHQQLGIRTAVYLAILLLGQWLFLFPRGRLTLNTRSDGRSAFISAIAAGLAGMLLTVGFAAMLLDLAGIWQPLMLFDSSRPPPAPVISDNTRWIFVLCGMAVLWCAWGALFLRFMRDRDHRTSVGRITRWLLTGTVLELLIAGPAHVWAANRAKADGYECYCARGSYTALVFGCTVLVWLFGPGIFLLVLRERRSREALIRDK